MQKLSDAADQRMGLTVCFGAGITGKIGSKVSVMIPVEGSKLDVAFI